MHIITEIRGAGLLGKDAIRRYAALTPGQPLILVREPDNPIDIHAIRFHDVLSMPVGYMATQDALRIAPLIDAGDMFLAQVIKSRGPRVPAGHKINWAQAKVWKTGETSPIVVKHYEPAL